MYKLHVKEAQKCMRHAMIRKYIPTPNLGFLPQIIYRFALGLILLELKPEVKVTVTWNQLVTHQGQRCIYIPSMELLPEIIWVLLTPEIKVTVAENSERHSIFWPQNIPTIWIWGLICHIIWDRLLTLCFACCVGELFLLTHNRYANSMLYK